MHEWSQAADGCQKCSPPGELTHCFMCLATLEGFLGEFFLIQIESLRIEGVVCRADCKTPLRHIYWAA